MPEADSAPGMGRGPAKDISRRAPAGEALVAGAKSRRAKTTLSHDSRVNTSMFIFWNFIIDPCCRL
jgi:hypothetical protein